jgi:hypothetical protein
VRLTILKQYNILMAIESRFIWKIVFLVLEIESR